MHRSLGALRAKALPFEGWNERLALAFTAIGGCSFPGALEAALRLLAPFQMMNGFKYSSGGRACDLYNERTINRAVVVDDYLAGAFVLDPFYDAVRLGCKGSFITMQQLAPDHFAQSEYYRIHYQSTGIVDELGFILRLSDGFVAVLSLCRLGKEPVFDEAELVRFRAAAPIVCAFGERHWFQVSGGWPPIAASSPARSPFDHPLLTLREREIVAMILKGHSTPSIALGLSLSPETVKVHRRHVYTKLNISSQAELFRVFLRGAASTPITA